MLLSFFTYICRRFCLWYHSCRSYPGACFLHFSSCFRCYISIGVAILCFEAPHHVNKKKSSGIFYSEIHNFMYSFLAAELETIKALFNEKEKELAMAVSKVDELTRQLEHIRQAKVNRTNNKNSSALLELEKLRKELVVSIEEVRMEMSLTQWPLGDLNGILDKQFSG